MEQEPAELALSVQHLAHTTRFSAEVLSAMKLRRSDALGFVAEQSVYRMDAYIFSNPLGRIEVGYPATPYEHFRQKYFPRLGPLGRWLLRRRPIRQTWVVKSAAAVFPEAHIPLPQQLGQRNFITYDIPKE